MVKKIGGAPATSSSTSDGELKDEWSRLEEANTLSSQYQNNIATMRETHMSAQEFRDINQHNKEKGVEYMEQDDPFGTALNEANEKNLAVGTQGESQSEALTQTLDPIELLNRNNVNKAQLDILQQQDQQKQQEQ